MTPKTSFVGIAACLLLGLIALPLTAVAAEKKPATADAASTSWVYPVIQGFGKVHPRADVAVQPDPNADYKVIVDVVHGSDEPSKVFHSLERLARTVNLLGFGKVPADHVHIVAVLDGEVAFAAGTNAMYRKHFKVDNPNLAILHALKQSGVELLVCSQAMAEMGLKDSDIGPDITISLSALSDFVIYGHRGYSYMQL
jgi:intracellular sulfur oxidation DsrE/DsrF family protein